MTGRTNHASGAIGDVNDLEGEGGCEMDEQSPAQRDRERFVGGWRLVTLEEPGADGTPHPVEATGLFVFTRDGHASVQVMMREPEAGDATGPVQYAQGGYEASFGRYAVDEDAGVFTFRIEGALVRSLVGQNLIRRYELSGTRLIVTPASPDEHWRVTWDRG